MQPAARPLFIDMDFDTDGNVVTDLTQRSATDPLLQHIVQRLMSGQRVSPEEFRYYELSMLDSAPAR
jgi:hypothetical protein